MVSAPPAYEITFRQEKGDDVRRISLFAACFAMACCKCLSQACDHSRINSAESAIQVLERLAPTTDDSDEKQCIKGAIGVTSMLHSVSAIPQLIRYLSFKRDKESWESSTVKLRPTIEGNDYPALVALAGLGEQARVALVQTIESEKSSSTELNNAAHAIELSFVYEPERVPWKGILYLRSAETGASPGTQERLERAVSYILTTDSCSRFSTKCADASQSTPR